MASTPKPSGSQKLCGHRTQGGALQLQSLKSRMGWRKRWRERAQNALEGSMFVSGNGTRSFSRQAPAGLLRLAQAQARHSPRQSLARHCAPPPAAGGRGGARGIPPGPDVTEALANERRAGGFPPRLPPRGLFKGYPGEYGVGAVGRVRGDGDRW